MAEANIVIIGAGVSGLTTALLLSKNPKNKVTIVAKHMPGDYDIEYASPWAGANYSPFAEAGTQMAAWEKDTWKPLVELADHVPEAGIHLQKSRCYSRTKDLATPIGKTFGHFISTDPWFKNTVRDFRVLTPAELPPGIDAGSEFTSLCINTAIYLPYLVSQCLSHGVTLQRKILTHISQAQTSHHSGKKADVVINCTGLLASKLGGVEDKSVVPARGQTVLVRNDPGFMGCVSGTDDGVGGDDELIYFMKRAAGGGTILGGSYQLDNWESQPDPNLALRIMTRAVKVCPQLTDGKGVEGLSIIRHGVGLRPYRTGGVRLEKERIEGGWVVHNYGHAGSGYQVSYACSNAVVKLVEEVLGAKAKLLPIRLNHREKVHL